MAEMMYLVRYYCNGQYYREQVPEYDLESIKNALRRNRDCVLISETKLGIDLTVDTPMYFLCIPYSVPGKNAVVDDPAERTRLEQIRELNPKDLAGFLSSFQPVSDMASWLLSTGSLQTEVNSDA